MSLLRFPLPVPKECHGLRIQPYQLPVTSRAQYGCSAETKWTYALVEATSDELPLDCRSYVNRTDGELTFTRAVSKFRVSQQGQALVIHDILISIGALKVYSCSQ
jgi:hypothetical protein